jgi:hypothetical protein
MPGDIKQTAELTHTIPRTSEICSRTGNAERIATMKEILQKRTLLKGFGKRKRRDIQEKLARKGLQDYVRGVTNLKGNSIMFRAQTGWRR